MQNDLKINIFFSVYLQLLMAYGQSLEHKQFRRNCRSINKNCNLPVRFTDYQ